MKYGDPFISLHTSLAHAMYEGFSDIHYEDRDWEAYRQNKESLMIKKSRKHSAYDVNVYSMFLQTWGSTSLGFGGIGGQAITTAYVIVLESEFTGEFCVYFGGRFAYKVSKPNEQFFLDINNHRMADVSNVKKYIKNDSN